jgi:hypothetical protein
VDVQVMPSYDALDGETVAFKVNVSPISISALGWLIAIDCTSITLSFLQQAATRNKAKVKKLNKKCLLIMVICLSDASLGKYNNLCGKNIVYMNAKNRQPNRLSIFLVSCGDCFLFFIIFA